MLQRQTFHEHQGDGDSGLSLTPAYFIGILKRRALYFAIPFLLILTVGAAITAVWPARYVSQGTILVQSQEIPSDLVRPTIAALANDRIQIIEQRVMTRDNLLAIAKKYRLTTGWLEQVSGTEIVDFIRKRTIIKPSEQKLETRKKEAIAFTVGFEYERPDVATRVANELVTMLLSEDVRSRTEFAAETTRFLAQEVTRLEGRLASVDAQLNALGKSGGSVMSDSAKQLAVLRTELITKGATYSDSHPEVQALKRKIAALEKNTTATGSVGKPDGSTDPNAAPTGAPGFDTLQLQRDTLREELNKASLKLSAARLGENLEKGQHSERLEVIEQPSMPSKPVSPNRPKIFGVVVALALMAGGGLAFGIEMLNQSIRTQADLFALIDRQLVVAIPYIATQGEMVRKKRKTVGWGVLVAAAAVAGLLLLFFVLPPLDVLVTKLIGLISR